MDQRFQVLQRHVQIAQRSSDIILAGDFNATLAGLPDEFETDLQVRGFTDPIVNSHGRRLLEFCKENRLYLSTGRTRGDEEGNFMRSKRGASDCSSPNLLLPCLSFWYHILVQTANFAVHTESHH